MSLKPCINLCLLRWLKPRCNLVDSFIAYGLKILKILLGEGLVNSKSLLLKILLFSEFLTSRLSFFIQLLKREKRVSKVIMLDFKLRNIITIPGIVNY